MQFHALPHQVRRHQVILEHAEGYDENDDGEQVATRYRGHQQDDSRRYQRTQRGDEFQTRSQGSQKNPVGYPEHRKKDAVGGERDRREQHQRPHVVRQQQVYIRHYFVQQFVAWPWFHEGENVIADGRSVFQKEKRQHRNDHHIDQVAGQRQELQAELRQRGKKIVGARRHFVLQPVRHVSLE